jgi:hypothetical protein
MYYVSFEGERRKPKRVVVAFVLMVVIDPRMDRRTWVQVLSVVSMRREGRRKADS